MRNALHLRFISLGSRLFAAFVAVLLLSLFLTAGSFWVQIRLYDSQQVQADLQSAAPTAYSGAKRALVGYWETAPGDAGEIQGALLSLRARLADVARTAHVRILLTDYCNHVPVDTLSTPPLVALPANQMQSNCSPVVDDMARGSVPRAIDVDQTGRLRRASDLPGGGDFLYLGYTAPFVSAYASEGGEVPLLVRAIVIAKSQSSVSQDALGSILPRLALAGAVAVLLTLLVVLLIVRAITRPLRTITAASERMARGDYDQRVPEAGADEVGQLARSFNRMATEVSSARQLQREFIANVSHDLKTPLTSILGFSQILAESVDQSGSPIQRRAVRVLNEEARRLQRLTLDLLDLSRLEAGQMGLLPGDVDLNDLAARALARYADLPANAALHFRDDRAPGSLLVRGDADRLMQALVNLLDNAVKFCNPNGTVAVATARIGPDVVLTVANTGAEIAEEDLKRVFQRFYRTDHSRSTHTGGTGLGLAIVREIVAAHGGHVEARSSTDGWTRFVVTLPGLALADPAPGIPLPARAPLAGVASEEKV